VHLIVNDKETFVPEWNENKSLPAEEQIVMSYDAMTQPVRKRVIQKSKVEFHYDKDGNPTGGSGEIDIDDEAPVRAVKNLVITNMDYERAGKTLYVRSADDLLLGPSGFHGLVKEFAEHLRAKAKEDIPEKN